MSYERQFRANIARLAFTYCAAQGLTLRSAGRIVFNDPRMFEMLFDGFEDLAFKVRTYDRIVSGLALVWPAGVPWPEGIEHVPAEAVRGPRAHKRRAPAGMKAAAAAEAKRRQEEQDEASREVRAELDAIRDDCEARVSKLAVA